MKSRLASLLLAVLLGACAEAAVEAVDPLLLHGEADSLLLAGELDGAEAKFRELLAAQPGCAAAAYGLACVAARTGELDEAFEWLAASVELGFRDRSMLERDLDLAALRSEPRFALALEAIEKAEPIAAPEEFHHPLAVRAMAVDVCDTGLVAVAYESGRILLLNGRDGLRLHELAPELESQPLSLAFSPDALLLAAFGAGGELTLWQRSAASNDAEWALLARKQSAATTGPHRATEIRLAWSPASTRLLVVATSGHAELWSSTPKLLQRWLVCSSSQPIAIWSRDGETLMTLEKDGEVFARDADGSNPVVTIRCRSHVTALAIDGSGTVATGHGNARIVLWDADGNVLAERIIAREAWFDPENEVAALSYSPRDDYLAASTLTGPFVTILAAPTLRTVWTNEPDPVSMQDIGFSMEPLLTEWSADGLWFAHPVRDSGLRWTAVDSPVASVVLSNACGLSLAHSFGVTTSLGDVVGVSLEGRALWRRVQLGDGALVSIDYECFAGEGEFLEDLHVPPKDGSASHPPLGVFDPKRLRSRLAGSAAEFR